MFDNLPKLYPALFIVTGLFLSDKQLFNDEASIKGTALLLKKFKTTNIRWQLFEALGLGQPVIGALIRQQQVPNNPYLWNLALDAKGAQESLRDRCWTRGRSVSDPFWSWSSTRMMSARCWRTSPRKLKPARMLQLHQQPCVRQ